MVRFVQHHRIHGRQQLSKTLIAQRHVGQKQVVIHDHDLSRQCAAPGPVHEARFELRTVGPKAVVLSGSDRVPDSGSLGNRGHFGPIAAGADAREPFDQPDVTGCLPGLLQAIADGAVQAVQADVILPPLQQHGVSSSL